MDLCQLIQLRVGALRVVVKKGQSTNFGSPSRINGVIDRGMALPPFRGIIFLLGVLGIMDEQISTRKKICHPAIFIFGSGLTLMGHPGIKGRIL